MVSKSNNPYLHKKKEVSTSQRDGNVRVVAETGLMQPRTGGQHHQKLENVRNEFQLEPLEGTGSF